jgi:hypothetical protein
MYLLNTLELIHRFDGNDILVCAAASHLKKTDDRCLLINQVLQKH